MSPEEMIVALVGTVAVFGLIGYLSAKTFGLIKMWLNRNKNGIPEEEFNRLAKAFMKYKKDTERRLKNLEAIASEQDSDISVKSKSGSKQVEKSRQNIEIEGHHKRREESRSQDSSNLRNMLRE